MTWQHTIKFGVQEGTTMLSKETLNEIISDGNILGQKCIVRDGFVFTSITEPHNVFDAIVIRNPFNIPCFFPRFPASSNSLEEHICLVNELQLEKCVIIGADIRFLLECPSLKYLSILPADSAGNGFDFSPLYHMPEINQLHCSTEYGESNQYIGYVDYSQIRGLKKLSVSGKGHLNCNKAGSLQSLGISCYKGKHADLSDLIGSEQLEELRMIQCSSTSLAGIELSKSIQSVELSYNRSLSDISHLAKVRHTLRKLSIQNCPKISNFTCLGELNNLEYLQLLGKNTLPNLSFLNNLPCIKRFEFSMDVADGDLSPCLRIPYVRSHKDRKHYNHMNSELPKNTL